MAIRKPLYESDGTRLAKHYADANARDAAAAPKTTPLMSVGTLQSTNTRIVRLTTGDGQAAICASPSKTMRFE
jgi:hypothetical protein